MMRGRIFILCWIFTLVTSSGCFGTGPEPAAVSAFNAYTTAMESRLAQQRRSTNSFLGTSAWSAQTTARLRDGELVIERLTPSTGADLPGALLHDWRGTAFIPNARVTELESLLKDFYGYPRYFAPEVLQARELAEHGGDYEVLMRVRQKHVISVVLDATYDVSFGRLDERRGYSISRSIRISEVEPSDGQRALNRFLWRLNTYWSYEERDGGLYVQIESVSLTPSIPNGLAWAVGPYVESIPRESLEFTLRSACNALRLNSKGQSR